MRKNEIKTAFALILMGVAVVSFPDKSLSITIAKQLSFLFVLIGLIKLIRYSDGNGRIGAVLFLAACLIRIITGIGDIFSSIGSMGDLLTLDVTRFEDILGDPSSLLSGVPFAGGLSNGSGFSFAAPDISWSVLLKDLLFLVSAILWLKYPLFENIKSGVKGLMVMYLVLLVFDLSEMFDLGLPGAGLVIALSGLFTVLFFYKITTKISPSLHISGVTLLAIGFIYTFLVLTDTGWLTFGYMLIGSVLVFVGSDKIRSSFDRKGTGAFIAYGVLVIFLGLIMHFPFVGGLLSTIIQLIAYIVLAIAFFRFSSNAIFIPNRFNGMILIGIITIVNIVLALIPTSLGVSSFIFCLIGLPLLMIGFVTAISSTKGDAVAVAPVVEAKIEEPLTEAPVQIKEDVILQSPVKSPEQILKEREEELFRRYGPKSNL